MSPFAIACEEACSALRQGKLLVFPTETFYALGCDALNADAVGAVFALKKRALHMPLPVVISHPGQLKLLTQEVSTPARVLMARFWPGPLSIVFPAREDVPDLLTAGMGRVAVRFSPHPAIRTLGQELNMVLVASSANVSGQAAPCRVQDLAPEITRGIAGVFDMPPQPAGGLPSTIVDVVRTAHGEQVRVLRQGAVPFESLEATGLQVVLAEQESPAVG